jgi:hypothetical protein
VRPQADARHASERACSSAGITSTARRNRLSAETFEGIQTLKDAYCTEPLDAEAEALKYGLEDVQESGTVF